MFINWFSKLTDLEVIVFIFIENFVLFLFSVLVAEFICLRLKTKSLLPPRAISRFEVGLALGCVLNNCLITILGFYLWKHGILVIRSAASFYDDALSFLVLFIVMDIAMYGLHRIAHVKFIYPYFHKTHHKFTEIRPLTLFALNPLETFGFGLLWLAVIYVFSPTWNAAIAYLIVNVIFGSIGHMSIEPFPSGFSRIPVLNFFTTQTFHKLHHEDINANFGFYTSIWDKLFKSIAKNYTDLFEESARHK